MISKPEKDVLDTTGRLPAWRPGVSQIASAMHHHFPPLSIEETETRRKWRRAALAFYGLIVISTILLIAIGPPDQTAAKNNPAYSAIASKEQNRSH